MKIFKYKLERELHQSILMPKGARIVEVAPQFNEAYVWAEVDSANEKERVGFYMLATGETNIFNSEYLGTVHFSPRSVYHIYKQIK